MKLDRRQFLDRTALLAGGAAGLALLDAPAARAAPSETVVCALIGAGGRGSYLMGHLLTNKHAAVAAVCDVNRNHLDRAGTTARNMQGKKVKQLDDFRRVLDDTSIDAVVIATPHHWHTPIAVRALQAGKHLYLEKPASHVFREGRLLVEAARKAKRVVQHGTQMRSSPVTIEAGKVLAGGVLGEIKQSKAWGVEPRGALPGPAPDAEPPDYLDFDRWLGPAPKRAFNPNRFRRWNNYRDYGNGEIGGDGIHDIDLARWGLGVTTHPVRILSHGSRVHLKGEGDFPDNMVVTWEYADGRVLIYENRNFAPYKMHGWDNGNVFYGTKGYMVFSRRGYFQTYLGAGEEKGPGMTGGAGNEEHVANFLDSIRAGKEANAGAEVAHLSCALVHLGETAYRTGRVLHFDPEAERVRDDPEADALLTKKYRDPWGFEKG